MPRRSVPMPEFIRQRIRKNADGCWIWTGAKMNAGYGSIMRAHRGGVSKLAHRVAWETWVGPIPPGRVVMHQCDVKLCINPAHLCLGTIRQNTQDAVRKGIFPRGEKHGASKLTQAQVTRIRQLSKQGMTGNALARRFHVSPMTISILLRGKTWRPAGR